MMIFITVLVAGFATESLESCPEDFCTSTSSGGRIVPPPGVDPVLLGDDEESGCTCKEFPRSFTLCYGRDACLSFPRNLNVSTNALVFKSSQILEIRPGYLDKMTHLEVLNFVSNENLTRVRNGSFLNMTKLKSLTISSSPNLAVLEKGSFNGLVSLENLYLPKNGFVDLSQVTPALAVLPKLSELVLSENTFNKIKQNDFEVLQNSTLTKLNLILCQIDEIHPKAFNPLKNLRFLRLGENNFNTTLFARVIEETINSVPLDVLNLYYMGLKKSTSKKLLAAIAKTNITKLCLARNQFETINSQTFPRMPKVEVLDLRESLILNISNDAFVGFPNLKTLLLKGNKLASIPDGVLLQQLTDLDLQENSGGRFSSSSFSMFGPKFVKMKNLEALNLSFNAILAIYNTSFAGLTNLRTLALKNATIYRIANGSFAMLSNLEFLDLTDNYFIKNYPLALEQGLLNGLVNLSVLLLGGCGITFISKEANPFRDLKKLGHLGLERNNLITLPNFEVVTNLQRIDLSKNGLQSWPQPIFVKNRQLKEVIVSDNKFAYLSTAMIQDFQNLVTLDLANNPFTCDCSFSWNDPKIMKLISDQKILCSFPESATSLTVTQFLQKQDSCQNLALIVPLAVLFVCLLVTMFSLYYFRWHLRYWIFLTRLHLSRNRKIRHLEVQGYTNYIYDAFVSYSNEDRNFVIRLVTMLENYPPFIKLCVYERDFEVGTMISENILESVAKSRKTVLIISNSYAKSQWCRWESQIAEHHRLFFQNENGEYVDDSLILIRLGPVNDAHMTPTLKYLLKTRIYLQWDGDEKKQRAFWEKLREALKPPMEINENTHL